MSPTEIQSNKANSSNTESPFFRFESNGAVPTKNYDKRNDFDFDIVWGIHISTY